jgi:trans-aconitate methyltransferase
MNEKTWMNGVWKTDEYETVKKISFDLLDSFLLSAPKNVLDIGCGLAFESELFQKKYNCDLYLLDGDFESSKNASRDRKYGEAESMAFYSKIPDLINSFNNRNLRYNFVDANNINLQEKLKFDLIYSNVSCGFHYPLSTYYDLLKKHSNKNSIMIFDINSRYLTEQVEDLFEVVESKNYPGQKKILKCKLKLKNKSGIKDAG